MAAATRSTASVGWLRLACATTLFYMLAAGATAQAAGFVDSHQKISDTAGGFTGGLGDQEFFGHALAGLGDLDGDGVEDLAVGESDEVGGISDGAVWLLFLNADGTVRSHVEIGASRGGFTGVLGALNLSGHS